MTTWIRRIAKIPTRRQRARRLYSDATFIVARLSICEFLGIFTEPRVRADVAIYIARYTRARRRLERILDGLHPFFNPGRPV